MARNRQRSKQRQAERRARRLEQQGASPPEQPRQSRGIPGIDPEPVEPVGGPGIDPDLAAGAPPEEEGRSDFALRDEPSLDDDREPPATEEEALEEIEDWELADDEPEEEAPDGAGESGYAVRGRRGAGAAEAHKDRPRVVQFLIACWAELQRVQWPNRQTLVTLTGVVLGFVLIAGGYLGLLDAIFSELIQAIL
jgi:preprotein translocase subunit SecE